MHFSGSSIQGTIYWHMKNSLYLIIVNFNQSQFIYIWTGRFILDLMSNVDCFEEAINKDKTFPIQSNYPNVS